MDYEQKYNEFIADCKAKEPKIYRGKTYSARNRLPSVIDGVYYERHHIKPAYRGRDDSAKNIVSMTALDHLYAHFYYAMWKDTERAWYGVRAMLGMPGSSKKRDILDEIDPEDYALMRKRISKVSSEAMKEAHANGWANKVFTEESRKKQSRAMKRQWKEHPEKWENFIIAANDKKLQKKRANAQRKKWENGEYEHLREASRQRMLGNTIMHDPEAKAKVSAAVKAYRARPEVKAAASKRLKKDNPVYRPGVVEKANATKKANFEKNKANVARVPIEYEGEIMSVRQAALREAEKGNRFSNNSVTKRAKLLKISVQESLNYYINSTNEQRQAAGTKKQKREVMCVETGKIFDSVKAAGEWISQNPANLYPALKSPHKTAGGYHWKYA